MSDTNLQKETESIISELRFDNEIAQLRDLIERWIRTTSEEVRALCEWQFSGTSKYYRPLTVFSCYRAMFGTRIPQHIVRFAAAVELFHNMSLVVDDILDKSPLRRGKKTLFEKEGELRALMTAGYIVADGYEMVKNEPGAIALLSELMKRLGAAECMQWRQRATYLGVESWRAIAREDTGSMFEVCACLGDETQQLRKYGQLIGIVYHGCDDVADVRGLQGLGGGGEEDLRDRILTLPAALAIQDEAVLEMFKKGDEDSMPALSRAYKEQLPSAERYLDGVLAEARREAETFAKAPEGLLVLAQKIRGLSAT